MNSKIKAPLKDFGPISDRSASGTYQDKAKGYAHNRVPRYTGTEVSSRRLANSLTGTNLELPTKKQEMYAVLLPKGTRDGVQMYNHLLQ
jgi:hypothetical protein